MEAALAAARMGAQTLLVTHNIDTLGQMSCNPAIGGIGKSHLVREIDAMGGAMARAADRAGIHFRVLNAAKGAAVRATRSQSDRELYKRAIRNILEEEPNLHIFQQSVDDLLLQDHKGTCKRGGTSEQLQKVVGVVTGNGIEFKATSVILATGTFLGGIIHIGGENYSGGRAGEAPANTLAKRLRALPFRTGRLKTGTPPRLDRRTIDFSVMEEQPGDLPRPVMSFYSTGAEHPAQLSCHITYTNAKTHKIVAKNKHKSPIYSGAINSVGPRYCPSIEDKIERFADKPQHQIFVEPEGLNSAEVYPNGISTALPYSVQQDVVHSIKGFEKAHMTRPGYAIEYDYFDPRDLRKSLETKFIKGLFFAGQINGTTGYEEAAAQGLIAGINATLAAGCAGAGAAAGLTSGINATLAAGCASASAGLTSVGASATDGAWLPLRNESYIAVMLDDLIAKGVSEPYRLFTSRAEYRLLLREDNADERLTPVARKLGLVQDKQWRHFRDKQNRLAEYRTFLKRESINPELAADKDKLAKINSVLNSPLAQPSSLETLLRRPEVGLAKLQEMGLCGEQDADSHVLVRLETDIKYAGYIARQESQIQQMKQQEDVAIPEDFDWEAVKGLSYEALSALRGARPHSLGAAGRLEGMTPAAVSIVALYLHKLKHTTKSSA